MMDLFRPYPVLRRVVVNLKSGTAFSGVVWQRRGEWLVLREAKILSDRGAKADQQVDGEVLVARADIDFIQVAG
mgnify:FL=1